MIMGSGLHVSVWHSTAFHSILDKRLCHDEVRFPCLAAVSRECLLKAARIRSDVEDGKAHQNGATVIRFLVVELAPAVLEFADGRWAQDSGGRVCEIDVPLVSVWVVHAQRIDCEVPCRALRLY